SALGLIQSGISGAQYVFHVNVLGAGSRAQAERDGDIRFGRSYWPGANLRANALRLRDHVGIILAARQQDQKFLAAIPADSVVVAHSRFDARRCLPEHRVASQVAVSVIDALEMIEVAEKHTNGFAFAICPNDLVLQSLENGTAIPKSGQRIMRG